MLKVILAGTTALALTGAMVAHAQQRPDRDRSPSVEDVRAYQDARLAALKAGLRMSGEQEAHWAAFELAMRDFQKLRSDRMAARMAERRDQQSRTRDPIERMRQRATAMAQIGAALQKLVDAVDPLYKSLDDSQKRRFAALAPVLGSALEGRDGPVRRFGWRDGGERRFDRDPRGSRRDGFDRGPRFDGDKFDSDRDYRGPERDRFDRGPRKSENDDRNPRGSTTGGRPENEEDL